MTLSCHPLLFVLRLASFQLLISNPSSFNQKKKHTHRRGTDSRGNRGQEIKNRPYSHPPHIACILCIESVICIHSMPHFRPPILAPEKLSTDQLQIVLDYIPSFHPCEADIKMATALGTRRMAITIDKKYEVSVTLPILKRVFFP